MVVSAAGDEVGFDFALDEIVRGLNGGEWDFAVRIGDAERGAQLVGVEVAAADVADFSLSEELLEGVESFLQGGLRIPGVELVEVDAVGAEASEAVFGGGEDAISGEGEGDFGGEGDFVAAVARGVPFTEDRFGSTLVVGLGGVEESDAVGEGVVEDGEGSVTVDFASEGDAAEAEGTDVEVGVAELFGLHGYQGGYSGCRESNILGASTPATRAYGL